MKYALFTSQFIGPVEDEEEAGYIAAKIEQSVTLNMEAVLERNGTDWDDIAEVGMRVLGVSVSVFDELPVHS